MAGGVFDEDLERIEGELPVPYPDRALLLDEIAADLRAAHGAALARGVPAAEARAAALRALALDEDARGQLAALHAPAVQRALARLPPAARDGLEALATGGPLLAVFLLLARRVPLTLFLREGGAAVGLVLATGALALVLEMQRLFLWFVLRDHSIPSLRKNTPTPLYLAGAALCLGVLGTAVDYYVVLARWSEGGLDDAALRVGLRESLPCVIVGSALAALVVLLHGALQVGLRAIRVPDGRTGPAGHGEG